MSPRRRRVVAVPHGYRSVPFLQLAAAAAPVCDLVWLVRSDDPVAAHDARVLRRLGPVVEVGDRDPAAVAADVAAHRPDGVVAFRDEDLLPTADLAERLGLAFHSPAVAERLADKAVQRRALRQGGVPTPGTWVLPAERDTAETAALGLRLTYPVVCKPRRGSGSRHTFVCADAAELAGTLGWLDDQPDGREPMVVEEYLPSRPGAADGRFADYVSVETLTVGGRRHHFAVTGRLHPAPSLRETGFFLPSDLAGAELAGVVAQADDALSALGVRDGACHTEVKLTPDGPRVIEVNGRLGGGVADLLAAASGADAPPGSGAGKGAKGGAPVADALAACLRAAVGQPAALSGSVPGDRIGFRLFLQPPLSARRVRAIEGLDAVRGLPGVTSVGVHLGPGEAVDPRQGSRAFVLALVGSARDHDQVAAVDRRMYEVAGVTYDHAADEGADAAPPSGGEPAGTDHRAVA